MEEKVAFYHPVQLKDIDPTVEIDSEGSMILDSPHSLEKRNKQELHKEIDDRVTHMRHRKNVEDNIK